MNSLCCLDDGRRRSDLRQRRRTGLDWLEVEPSQTELRIGFIGRAPDGIGPDNIRILGGRRERNIRAIDVRIERSDEADLDDVMIVAVDRPGDYSTYHLEVVDVDQRGRPTHRVPKGFDAQYTGIDFSFKADCRADQDPAERTVCPEGVHEPTAISYLAKDYQSFRQLMLDRMALTAPAWTEQHAPDLGITLVELLAYAADDLSYYQDAVATEAYLGTARLRQSVRRHVRLVDYWMDEGRSAQGWVQLTLDGADELEIDPRNVMFTSSLATVANSMVREQNAKIAGHISVFEPAPDVPIRLRSAHNVIDFYDWGSRDCCLLKGATSATLKDPGRLPDNEGHGGRRRARHDEHPENTGERNRGIAEGRWHQLHLSPGDVLLFAERISPRTGLEEDADPQKRHAVRLTAADYSWDSLTETLLVEIAWCPEDALPFPLCLSSTTQAPQCEAISRVSVTFGNIVAVDHGRSVEDELEPVATAEVDERCPEPCEPAEVRTVKRRYRPQLPQGAPSFIDDMSTRDNISCSGCGARAASRRGIRGRSPSLPAVRLLSVTNIGEHKYTHEWVSRPDLLDSNPDERHFVVEVDCDGGAALRFGDGVHGRSPESSETFRALYRVGGGTRGNVGAGALRHVVFRNAFPEGVRISVTNPLPMVGGCDPESAASARLRAPFSFRRRLERAVTADDYAAIVMRDFPDLVQRAAATLRSTGIGTEVQIAIDPSGRTEAPQELLSCIERHLERYRRIGHDVRVVSAQQVPIDLRLEICVESGFVAEDVARRARERLGRSVGGFFNPDALNFGEGIAVSRLVAAVHSVEGVADVRVTRLNRLFEEPDDEIELGLLPVGSTEIVRLDQDADAPENGRLCLIVKGGR